MVLLSQYHALSDKAPSRYTQSRPSLGVQFLQLSCQLGRDITSCCTLITLLLLAGVWDFGAIFFRLIEYSIPVVY